MNNIKRTLSMVILLPVIAWPASAVAADVAVDVHAGSLGNGIGASVGLTPRLNMRLGINSAEYKLIDVEDDEGLNYEDPEIDFDNKYLFLDWYVFRRGTFHLTAGYVFNDNEVSAAAVAGDNARIGNAPVPEGTRVDGRIFFDDGAYAGLGWGNAFGEGNRFHFSFDLGLLFQGSPRADLTTNADVPDDEVERERLELEEEVADADTWPVINFGFGVRF